MDKTGNKVKWELLTFVFDHATTHQLAWGTSALANVYRQLGEGSRTGTRQMAGFSPLVWVRYLRLAFFFLT